MELTASGSADARAQPRRLTARIDPPAIAAWTLAFSVVVYLALSNGGYDTIVRSQVGIAVWWIVLLGALTGVLPMRFGRAGWVAIGLLAGFAVWTGLAATWSESAERSVMRLGRVAAYLGVLVLAITLRGRSGARHAITGLACAIGLVTGIAVLSRLHPQWFPVNDHVAFLAGSERKLSFPLNYWNALAAFAAMGVPLLLGVALGGRTLAGQATAAATLPLSILCVYLTVSRGGALALGIGVLVFLTLVARRLEAIGTLLVSCAGAAILILAASQRDALQDGLPTATAIDQGTQLLWLAASVCAGVALLQVAMGLAMRHVERAAWLEPGRRRALLQWLIVVATACVIALAVGVPGYANERWREFKAPIGAVAAGAQDNVFSRLSAANGNGRYEFWEAAREADATSPLTGIGPGTFEFWWSRHRTTPGFVRDAHSLYFETLAETGIVGMFVLGVFLALLLLTAVARSLRAAREQRNWIAGAAGGIATFMIAAALEWVWEVAAIVAVVMVLAAVILAAHGDVGPHTADLTEMPADGRLKRTLVAVLAALAIAAVAVPMAAALAVGDSRSAAVDGRPDAALEATRTAERIQPYAATPHVQQALVLEQADQLSRAAAVARAATVAEPTNWRTWFVLARIQARRGRVASAVAALRIARRLNSGSPILGGA